MGGDSASGVSDDEWVVTTAVLCFSVEAALLALDILGSLSCDPWRPLEDENKEPARVPMRH